MVLLVSDCWAMLAIMNLMTESRRSSTAYLSARNKTGMAFSVVITIVPEDGVGMRDADDTKSRA